MTSKNQLSITPLQAEDAAAVCDFLQSQPAEYSRFFYAFGTDLSAVTAMLKTAEKDAYAGVYWTGSLIGMFMLRGLDEGYSIPSFGVIIDEKYRGGVLMRLTLDVAKLTCRLSGIPQMMAKIHPDNMSPKGAARLGFRQTGIEEATGNVVYHMDL